MTSASREYPDVSFPEMEHLAPPPPDNRPKVYVASQTKHRDMWLRFRELHIEQFKIVSSWLDIERESTPEEYVSMWDDFTEEAATCDALIAVFFPGDEWKGVFFEIGVAVSHERPAYLIGEPPGSWTHHRLVHKVGSLREATQQIIRRS